MNITHKPLNLTLIFFMLFLFHSCGLVEICYPNRWNERYAKSHGDIECLSALQLKEMLVSDTSHYKIVMIYSPCCGPCLEHLRRIYAPAFAMHRSDVTFYLINENTGGIKYCRDELQRLGLYDGKVLCFLDDNPDFDNQNQGKNLNPQILNNLANFLFSNGPAVSGNFGTPCEFIVSKDNRVLKRKVTTPSSATAIQTAQLWQIDFDHIQDINFDSVYHIEFDFEAFEGLPVCDDNHCPFK